MHCAISYNSTPTRKQHVDKNNDSHSHKNGSNRNALLSKQHSIFSANEVSLSRTLAIISLKLVIWLVSFPLTLNRLGFSESGKAGWRGGRADSALTCNFPI